MTLIAGAPSCTPTDLGKLVSQGSPSPRERSLAPDEPTPPAYPPSPSSDGSNKSRSNKSENHSDESSSSASSSHASKGSDSSPIRSTTSASGGVRLVYNWRTDKRELRRDSRTRPPPMPLKKIRIHCELK